MEQICVLVIGATPQDPPPGLPELAHGIRYEFTSSLAEAQQLAPHADVIFVWEWETPLLRPIWPLAERLKWVHVVGVGLEWILFPELVESDVILTNSRGMYDHAIAEYAVALMLLMSKDLARTMEDQRLHQWNSRSGELLYGRTLLLIGLGSIARAIGRLGAGMGMSIKVVAARARTDAEFGWVESPDRLPDVVREADYIVVAAPLTDKTRNLIGRPLFEQMMPTARVINLGRGAIFRDEDLIWALESGRIAGAALDVFREEPLPSESPLWELPNVVISPHMSAVTPGEERRFVDLFLVTLAKWLTGQPLDNVIDKQLGYVVRQIE